MRKKHCTKVIALHHTSIILWLVFAFFFNNNTCCSLFLTLKPIKKSVEIFMLLYLLSKNSMIKSHKFNDLSKVLFL